MILLKKVFFFSIFNFIFSFANEHSFKSAKLCYDQKKYQMAIDLFNNSLKENNIDKAKVFYNIANCYSKMTESTKDDTLQKKYLAKTIFFYEKSLLYKPANKNSLENLKYILNRFSLLESYQIPKVSNFVKVIAFYYYLSFNTQVIILFTFLFFLMILFAVVIFFKKMQKIFLISFIVYILLATQFILRARVYKNNLYALTEKTISTYKEPNFNSKTEKTIPNLNKLLLEKKDNDFFRIKIKGKKFWISEKDVLIIH